ncbi:MAG TPA: hypothetical protein VLC06_02855, partial [Polyangia bacterium]|nr:hypothetical protein [Polyangia bacterium]
ADPAHRYQSMAQFEYDLVKSLFGRSRAVSEMLGLHDQERGVVPEISYSDEAPGGTHARADSPLAAPRRAASPVPPPSRQREEERGADAGFTDAAVTGAARDSGGGWRYAGTFAALALVGVAAVTIYRRLPWSAHAQTAAAPSAITSAAAPAPPSDADRRAQRLRSGVADVERMLGSGFGFAQLPALQEQLGRLRTAGGTAIADTLATRAKGLLVKAAEEELDRGEIEAGVAHYRIALALDAHGGGEAELVAALRTRAQSALSANKDTEAVRWAREAVAFSGGDAAAHALLAECLHALREDGEAVTEYEKALATRPDDPTFTHGLSAARHALATDAKREHTSHAHRAMSTATPAPVEALPAAPAEAAPPSDQPAVEAPERERPSAKPEGAEDKREDERSDPRDDKTGDKGASEKPAPSAPVEPAPDQQH